MSSMPHENNHEPPHLDSVPKSPPVHPPQQPLNLSSSDIDSVNNLDGIKNSITNFTLPALTSPHQPPANTSSALSSSSITGGLPSLSHSLPPLLPPGMKSPNIQGQPTQRAEPGPAASNPINPVHYTQAVVFLDRVRDKFINKPAVFEEFRDIMERYKNKTVDTVGVVNKVKVLFKGHWDLITSFNNFVPKKFRIEASSMDEETNVPSSTGLGLSNVQKLPPASSFDTPSQKLMSPTAGSGTSTIPRIQTSWNPNDQITGDWNSSFQREQQPMNQPSYDPRHFQGSQNVYNPSLKLNQPVQRNLQTTTFSPQSSFNQKPLQHLKPIGQVSATSNLSQPSMEQPIQGSVLQPKQLIPAGPNATSSPALTHAVEYLKKVKHRFANDPRTYQTFLEILHTFHRDPRSVNEVCSQVASLLRNHSDLLEEFSCFLPDQKLGEVLLARRSSDEENQDISRHTRNSSTEYSSQRASTRVLPSRRHQPPVSPPQKRLKLEEGFNMELSHEDKGFFDQIKLYLDNNRSYLEFLKCLNLFTCGILNLNELVALIHGFLGKNQDLFSAFKSFVGYTEKSASAPSAPSSFINTFSAPSHADIDLTKCKKIGSYRLLPKVCRNIPCSGRTQLCREVLNDFMVSCPTFASEDATFLSSKKNQYEEALFKCEDERYEMDLLIDGIEATIQVFLAVKCKMEKMEPSELEAFKLDYNLGGTSESIYRRILRKIYGEKANIIIDGIMNNPSNALAVVLPRLEQKHDEWKRAQREWNKIWRELHVKNHYRSLDHRGIDFKNSDKRNFSMKSIVSEIEAIHVEQQGKNINPNLSLRLDSKTNICHQEFYFKDVEVMQNVQQLIMSHISNSNYIGSGEKRALTKFIQNFIPDFFVYDKTFQNKLSSFITSVHELETADESGFSNSSQSKDKKDSEENPNGNPRLDVLLFSNNVIYAFFRLFQMAYSRLLQLKCLSTVLPEEQAKKRLNPVAQRLGIQKPLYDFDLINSNFYDLLTQLLLELIECKIDSSVFEERCRFLFGMNAYVVYTFDKLIYHIVKQVQTILNDVNCENLIRLFDTSRQSAKIKSITEAALKNAAESLVGPRENIYRIHFNPNLSSLTVLLLGKTKDSMDEFASVEEKWSQYVDNFVRLESVDLSVLKNRPPLYLNRCKRSNNDSDHILVNYNLECKICVNTYKMFFVEHSEDFLYNPHRELSMENSINNDRSSSSITFYQHIHSDLLSHSLLGIKSLEEAQEDYDEWFSEGGYKRTTRSSTNSIVPLVKYSTEMET